MTEAPSPQPDTDVVERVARAICRSGKFETGEGTCSLLCMEFLGDPRKNGCAHATKIHGELATATLNASTPEIQTQDLLRSPEPVPVSAHSGDDPGREEAALARFTEYFVRNYPGPNTIIGNPHWHAPKIFRAALHAIESTRDGSGNRSADNPLPLNNGD